MFEAERLLLEDMPFIPVYSYVTKRMVNPRLKGWESNVMDHHYSKHMFFLKAASEAYQLRRAAEKLQKEQQEDNDAAATGAGAGEQTPLSEGENIPPAEQTETSGDPDQAASALPEGEAEPQPDDESAGSSGL